MPPLWIKVSYFIPACLSGSNYFFSIWHDWNHACSLEGSVEGGLHLLLRLSENNSPASLSRLFQAGWLIINISNYMRIGEEELSLEMRAQSSPSQSPVFRRSNPVCKAWSWRYCITWCRQRSRFGLWFQSVRMVVHNHALRIDEGSPTWLPSLSLIEEVELLLRCPQK